MNSFSNLSNLFNRMMGSQVQTTETEDPQPKLYPTIVSLSSNYTHPIVVTNTEQTHLSKNIETHYAQLAANPSPGIPITPTSRNFQAAYSDYCLPNYHPIASSGLDSQTMSYAYYLNEFSLSEYSVGESCGSFSEASLTFSPPQPVAESEFSPAENWMNAQNYMNKMKTAEPSELANAPELANPPADIDLEEIFAMDEAPPVRGRLFAPGAYGVSNFVQGFSSLPARPVETYVTTRGSMVNDSPSEDSAYLSPTSTTISESLLNTPDNDSPLQLYYSPLSSSAFLEIPDYPLVRTSSGGKVRKPPSDLKFFIAANGERRYQCRICNHTSNRPNNLREHQLKHDPNRPRPHHCDICTKCFARKNDLKRHLKVHLRDPEAAQIAHNQWLLLNTSTGVRNTFG